MKLAACKGKAPLRDADGETNDSFFPNRGSTSQEAVLRYCLHCEVREECDEYADRLDIKVGIWGGKRRTRTAVGTDE